MSQDLDETIERYHRAADAFARGDADPVKQLFSHSDDVTLANPFGPAVQGWQQVADALDSASSRFRDGEVEGFDSRAKHATDDLAAVFEIEHWHAKVGASDDLASFVLRVSTTLRREDGGWKLVHRHADPIATSAPSGPLRRT